MIYLFLADGFEEMEAIAPYDLIKRNGFPLKTVGIGKKEIVSSHGMTVLCDISESEIDLSEAEAFVLPGGKIGAQNLRESKKVEECLFYAVNHNLYICANCASPIIVLSDLGILDGKKYTCYPGMENEKGIYTAKEVEVDGKIVTANGPSASYNFALKICDLLKDQRKE